MHVAINGWFWDHPYTGSGQYLRRLVQALRQLEPGLKISLVLPPHSHDPDELPIQVDVITTGHSRRTGRMGKVWFEQVTFPRMAQRVAADLAHVPYWGPPLATRMPLIVSVLDVIPLQYPQYALGAYNRLYVSLVSTAARGAAQIITISQTARLDIEQRLGIPAERITATYLAQDERFHPKIGQERHAIVRKKYNLPEHYVLYLGGFDARKRVNDLLLAYTWVSEAEGDNYPLVIAGREPKWGTPLFPDLREYARRLNIEDYVRWIGYVDEEDKPSLYRMADVFVYPSEYEGFGLPPLEAMACATPVVTSNALIFEEVLGSAAYAVEDARSMAGAILALLLQEPLRHTMINQGLAQATKYSWRKTARATLDVYERVLQRARA